MGVVLAFEGIEREGESEDMEKMFVKGGNCVGYRERGLNMGIRAEVSIKRS